MGDVKALFATDPKKEIEGVWENLGEGIQILVARIGNPNYQKVLNKLLRPHRMSIRRGTLADEVLEECIVEAMSQTILLNWKGIQEDKVDVPYSVKEARRLLTEYKDFREQVSEFANSIESFRLEQDKAAEKN